MSAAAGASGFDVAIPRVACSRLELALPADPPPVEVPSACGGVSLEKDPPRLLAELGPTDRLAVRWRELGGRWVWTGGQRRTTDLAKDSARLGGRQRQVQVPRCRRELRQVQLAVDPRLRLLPLAGDALPTVQVGAESDQTRRITFRWPRPIADEATLEATLLFSGASAVGNIPLPRIELVDIQATRRWMALSVDPALDCESRRGSGSTPARGRLLEGLGTVPVAAAGRLPLAARRAAWTLATRLHEPRMTAGQTLSLSFDEDRIDVLFDARLSVASGYVFQQQVTAPRDFEIERVSLVVDRSDRIQRWSQDKQGTITAFLDGPLSGAARFCIRGRLPLCMGQTVRAAAVRRAEVQDSDGGDPVV